MFLFFFKQKTADEMLISDWSSDGCSSDLRPVGAEREATLWLVDLHGGDAEVEGDAGWPGRQAVGEQALHVAEAAFDDGEAAGIALAQIAAVSYGGAVAVDASDCAVGGLQHGAAVAAGAVIGRAHV